MDWRQFTIGREEHAFIAGATGSGKSELAQWLINDPNKRYSIVYDQKHSRTIGEWRGQTIIYSWEELTKSEERRIVYRPSREAYLKGSRLTNEAEDPDEQERFFQFVFETPPRRLYVDECSALLGETRPNYYLKGCLTRGRELGLSTVCATQRPVSIPVITMSEATHMYFFQLNWPDDCDRVEKLTGGRITVEEQATLQRYEFFYYNSARKWRAPGKIKLNLRGVPSPQSSSKGELAYAG